MYNDGLPKAIYRLATDKNKKHYLEYDSICFDIKGKDYGNINDNLELFWDAYEKGIGSMGVMLTGDSGTGKALKHDTPILTPNGWVNIEDIKVNDEVIAVDGSVSNVTGVYPQGVRELYDVTLVDDRTLTVDGDHLWSVYVNSDTVSKVMTTNDINILLASDSSVSIDLYRPDTELDIALQLNSIPRPFIVGTCIANQLEEIKDTVLECNGVDILDNFITSLYNKDITYINVIDKINILQGLLSKYSIFKDDELTYINSDTYFNMLIKDIVNSLGGYVLVSDDIDTHLVKLPNNIYNIYTGNTERITNLSKIDIVKITKTDDAEAICIAIDHPSKLYVAKDYIVTHNTRLAEKLCNRALSGNMSVVLVAGMTPTINTVMYLSMLRDVVIIFDEFGKMFNHNLQDKMLSMFSDVNGGKRLFIITENSTNLISRFILNRPGRMRYHIDYERVDISVLEEYCSEHIKDYAFYNELLNKYNSSSVFSFDQLQAIVTEHNFRPQDTFETILNRLNVSILNKPEVLRFVSGTKGDDTYTGSINGRVMYKDFNTGRHVYCSLTKVLTEEESEALNDKTNQPPTLFNSGRSQATNASFNSDDISTIDGSEITVVTTTGYTIVISREQQ